MAHGRDDRDVRERHDRARGCGLIGDDNRRSALDSNDFSARNALRRALLRRAREHGEEQQSEERM